MWVPVLVLLATQCFGAKLPFKTCDPKHPDFNQCLGIAIQEALSQLTTAKRDIGLPSLDPLEIPKMYFGAGTGPVAFYQDYRDMKITGFTRPDSVKANFDSNSNVLTLDLHFPQVVMKFDYEANGRLLILPLSGKGPGTITLNNVTCHLTFALEEYQKKDTKYFKTSTGKLELEPELIHFQLDNLFNGDKLLGDNINKVINENWKEVFGDVKSSYEEAFGKIFTSIFDNLLSKVSVSELFSI